MSNNRLLIISILSLSLGGCASTNNKCVDGFGKPLTYKTEITEEIRDTTARENLYEKVLAKEFSGIVFSNRQNATLTLRVINQAKYEEYSAPIIDKTYITTFNPPLVTKVLLPLLPIMLPVVIFNPKGTYNEFFGCTQQQTISGLSDLTRKVKTGKTEWRDLDKSHKILISGFNKDYEFERSNTPTKEIKIDLSEAILNTEISKNTTIKITCLDCDLLGQEEQNIFKNVKKSVELSADFRDIKTLLVAQEKGKKIEQSRLEKEAELQRVIKEKENIESRKESLGVPLNDFKIQCKELGFKEGTTDFGNCVLQLNDKK